MTTETHSLQELPEALRQHMPVVSRWAYFDHAAVAPLSGPARQALIEWSEQAVGDGNPVWSQWSRRIEQVRETAANMIGAVPDEIALVPNTTHGINLVANGFPWRRGDNVVTLANEFPSNLYPWMNLAERGVQTRRVPVEAAAVDLDRVANACDHRTRIVAVSWVGFATGWKVDVDQLAKMAHDHNALLMLDAIQGLGVFPLDVGRTPVDFLAADGHKWLLSPEGAGLFYMRREHLDLLQPLGVGWNSVVQQHDFTTIDLDLRPAAARYEGGSQNMAGFLALGASLDLLTRLGLTPTVSPLADHVISIVASAANALDQIGARVISDREPENASGILAFQISDQDPRLVRRQCLEAGVALSCRGGCLRISPHAYANQEDLDRLISVLSNLNP